MDKHAQQVLLALQYTREQIIGAYLFRKNIDTVEKFKAWLVKTGISLPDPARLNLEYAIQDLQRGNLIASLIPSIGFKRSLSEAQGKKPKGRKR